MVWKMMMLVRYHHSKVKNLFKLYETNKGTIQHNHEDDSFYFRLADDVTMASYVDSELKIEDPNGQFNDHVTFANSLMAK
jgi:hypothetical protein